MRGVGRGYNFGGGSGEGWYTGTMPRSSHQFVDDRGQPAAVPQLSTLDGICARIPGLRTLLVELDPTRPRLLKPIRTGQLAWYSAACAAWATVYVSTRGQPLMIRFTAGGTVIVLVVVGSYFRRRAGFRRGLMDVRRVMLEASLCPSCTHPLDGLPRLEDGCVVCPECGSAWRVDAIIRSLPPDA